MATSSTSRLLCRPALLLLLLAMCLAQSARAGSTVIRFRLAPEVTTGQARLTLGDIADLAGDDPALVLRLRQLPLGRAPQAGQTVAVSRDDVTRWIRAAAGGWVEARGEGAMAVRISVRAAAADGARMATLAQQALSARLAAFPGRAVIALATSVPELKMPGKVEFTVRPLGDGTAPAASMVVWVDVLSDGEFFKAVPLRFNVALMRTAWTMRSPAAAGARLVQEELRLAEVDVAGLPPAARVRDERDPLVTGGVLRARQRLQPGEVLTEVNSDAWPAVARGQMLTLNAVAGGVTLVGRGQALEDGRVGQVVQVRSAISRQPLQARITGPGQAEIE